MGNLYVALIHYPVTNRQGDIIASAVTNLDLHDIARTACTYGVKAFHVVTPLTDQTRLVETIVAHWTKGGGGRRNPKRREALSLIRIETSLAEVLAHIGAREGERPAVIATSARHRPNSMGFGPLREMIHRGSRPCLLLFGTAWGLSEALVATADYVLEPVNGPADYNHLSVRSAAAIVLDRLMGRR
jgi:hypothetical protein